MKSKFSVQFENKRNVIRVKEIGLGVPYLSTAAVVDTKDIHMFIDTLMNFVVDNEL